MKCSMPSCPFHAEPNGWCARHKDYEDNTQTVKVSKPPKEPKMHLKAVEEELNKMYPVFLAQRPICELKKPNCTKKATCVHHANEKEDLFEVGKWLASCESCRQLIDGNQTEKEKKELKKRSSKMTKSGVKI